MTIVSTRSFCRARAVLMTPPGPSAGSTRPGQLTLAFVMLYGRGLYVVFSIPDRLGGSLSEEVPGTSCGSGRLAVRLHGSSAFHFFVPFFLLLVPENKRSDAEPALEIGVGIWSCSFVNVASGSSSCSHPMHPWALKSFAWPRRSLAVGASGWAFLSQLGGGGPALVLGTTRSGKKAPRGQRGGEGHLAMHRRYYARDRRSPRPLCTDRAAPGAEGTPRRTINAMPPGFCRPGRIPFSLGFWPGSPWRLCSGLPTPDIEMRTVPSPKDNSRPSAVRGHLLQL